MSSTHNTHARDVTQAKLRLKAIKRETQRLNKEKKSDPHCPVNKSWKMEECAQCQSNQPGHISIRQHRARLEKELELLRAERRQLNKIIRSARL